MRVAFIGYNFTRAATRVPDRVGRWLAEMLASRGLDVHYLCFTPGADRNEVSRENGLTIHDIACPAAEFALRKHFGPRRTMAKHVKMLAPDVVHSQYVLFAIIGQHVGIPSVATVHGIYHREVELYSPLRRFAANYHLFFYKRALRQIKNIISISPYAKKELEKFTAAQFWPISNPVNPAFFELDANNSEPGRILYVGRWGHRKSVMELLQAFRIALSISPTLKLRLVGKPDTPEYYSLLKKFVENERITNAVTFVGAVDEQGLLEEFESASVLALMSRQETAPGVISEALASGTTVVANAICGIPSMVLDDETGLLATPGNIEEFGHKLAELATDPSRCRRYGERGREIARTEYDPQKVAEATIKVYQNLLSSANREAAKCSSS